MQNTPLKKLLAGQTGIGSTTASHFPSYKIQPDLHTHEFPFQTEFTGQFVLG